MPSSQYFSANSFSSAFDKTWRRSMRADGPAEPSAWHGGVPCSDIADRTGESSGTILECGGLTPLSMSAARRRQRGTVVPWSLSKRSPWSQRLSARMNNSEASLATAKRRQAAALRKTAPPCLAHRPAVRCTFRPSHVATENLPPRLPCAGAFKPAFLSLGRRTAGL